MRIAILEDEPAQMAHLAHTLRDCAATDGVPLTCMKFNDGEALRRSLRSNSFDLLVLDWNVPGLSGIDLLRWLRAWQQNAVPVLMLSSRTSEGDVVQALDLGADDYIVKPFRALELRARVRRLMTGRQPGVHAGVERFDGWEFDRLSRSVRFDPSPASELPARSPNLPTEQQHLLTEREFNLALALFRNMGRIVSRAHLLESTGYPAEEMPSRTLDSHIYRLRNKLALHAARGLSLQTVYGRGYRLETMRPEAAAAR
jgi:DNA-binding response OmpR family regulator